MPVKHALSLTIRPFTATRSDYAAWLRVRNAVWADEPTTAAIRRHLAAGVLLPAATDRARRRGRRNRTPVRESLAVPGRQVRPRVPGASRSSGSRVGSIDRL